MTTASPKKFAMKCKHGKSILRVIHIAGGTVSLLSHAFFAGSAIFAPSVYSIIWRAFTLAVATLPPSSAVVLLMLMLVFEELDAAINEEDYNKCCHQITLSSSSEGVEREEASAKKVLHISTF